MALSRAGSTASSRSAVSDTSSLGKEVAATNISGSLNPFRDGLRPPQYLSKGDDVVVTTNFLRLKETPTTIYQYAVEFGPTIPKQPGRAGREVRRRDEKVQVFRAFQQEMLQQHNVHFAFPHAGDLLWTLK